MYLWLRVPARSARRGGWTWQYLVLLIASGGSRYENGRTPAKPVRMLAALAYGPERDRKATLGLLGPVAIPLSSTARSRSGRR